MRALSKTISYFSPRYLAWCCCSIAIVFIPFFLIVGIGGANPIRTFIAILFGAFGNSTCFIETLTRATPIIFCALAVSLPARTGIFNIGGEGQLYLGAVGATLVALKCTNLPIPFSILAMSITAAIFGGLWASIPAFLKVVWNVNEVLVALMLNYVAIFMVEYLVHGPWRDPSAIGWPYSARFSDAMVLPTYGTTNLHIGLIIAFTIAILLSLVMKYSTVGFSMKIIEANPSVAKNITLRISHYLWFSMFLGGAIAAMAGIGEVSVIQGRLRPGISPGYGYAGFLVAWLSSHRFAFIIPVSVLIGGLYSGADELQLTAGLPSATADILMGMVFIGFLIGNHLYDRYTPLKNGENKS